MGKGKSPLRGGGTAKTQVATQSGIVADLTGTPLVYGAKDSALSVRQRVAMEAQEKKRLTAKIEYAMSVDANGGVLIFVHLYKLGKMGKGQRHAS